MTPNQPCGKRHPASSADNFALCRNNFRLIDRSWRNMEQIPKVECVHGERRHIGDLRYDLAVYCVDDSFYAAWWCAVCLIREQTPNHDTQSAAHDAGIESLKAHAATHHASG
jgi:hypothetical protein